MFKKIILTIALSLVFTTTYANDKILFTTVYNTINDNHITPVNIESLTINGLKGLSEIDKNDPNFELSTPSFDIETLKTYELPIILDFGAEWCNPCKRMHPVLEELNSELRGRAIIKYIDIDKYPEATKGFNFTLIPTQYFITKDGEIYKSHTGFILKEDVIKILNDMEMK